MALNEILTLLAIALSPLFAVQVSRYLENRKEDRDRKLYVFRTLMATRGAKLSINHVNALNMIDVEFYGKDRKSKQVVDAWKLYLNHLKIKDELSEEIWSEKSKDLFETLLDKMAIALKYDFDRVSIKETSYYPRGYEDMDIANIIIRQGLADVLSGKIGLPITVFGNKFLEELLKKQERLFDKQIDYFGCLDPNKPVKVEIVGKDSKQ
jgi:hypothetical protein